MSPKSSKHCGLDRESDGVGGGAGIGRQGNFKGVRKHGIGTYLILIPHPHPKENTLQGCPSSVPFPEWSSHAQQDSFTFSSCALDFCKCLGHREWCQESWTFSQLRLLCCNPDKPVPFEFLLCHVHLADAKRLRCGLGAEPWRLSTARLTAGFPASTCLTIPGSGSIAYSWGNFPSVISFIIASPPSVLFTLSRIPNGSLWSLQDSFYISPLLSHYIYLFVPFFWIWGKLLTLIFQMTNLDFGSIQTIVWPPLHWDILMIVFAFPAESTFWLWSFLFHWCNLRFV